MWGTRGFVAGGIFKGEAQRAALTRAGGRVSMKIGEKQTRSSGGRDSAGDHRVSQALS